jgi:hypothetical protein
MYIRVFNVEETESAFRNAFFTAVSLTISTLIYGRNAGSLSLVDGLIVTFLPYVVTVGAANNTLAIVQGKTTLKLAYILHLVFCASFGLAVWANIDTYGTTPGCNLNSSVKFVVFGQSVGATSKGLRGFALFVFSLIIVLLPSVALQLLLWPPRERLQTDGFEVLAWLWTAYLGGTWVYEVVTIEQIIRRNGLSHDTSQWTYGQTFSMVLLLGPAFDFVSALWRRRHGTNQENIPTSGINILCRPHYKSF